jgi:hypothetical protein
VNPDPSQGRARQGRQRPGEHGSFDNHASGFMNPRFRRPVPKAARTVHQMAVAAARDKRLTRDDNKRLG